MKMRFPFAVLPALVVCTQMAPAAEWAENLVVPRGETLTLDTSYATKTNTSMSVSGTLNISFNTAAKHLTVYPTTDVAAIKSATSSSARTMIDVGPDAGDNGVINIDRGYLYSWASEGVCLYDIVIGRNGGTGAVRINPFGGSHTGYVRTYKVELSANAQTDEEVFDALTIGGAGSYIEITNGHLVNKNAKPLRVTFENREKTTNYGYLRTYGSTQLFDLSTAGCGDCAAMPTRRSTSTAGMVMVDRGSFRTQPRQSRRVSARRVPATSSSDAEDPVIRPT